MMESLRISFLDGVSIFLIHLLKINNRRGDFVLSFQTIDGKFNDNKKGCIT